jgi:hypothetical protein
LQFRNAVLICSLLLLGPVLIHGARGNTITDVFPAALPNYAYGGWQGPFGDGTAGRLYPTVDGSGIYADATYNGLVWALRSSPEFSSIDMSMQFNIPNRDFTFADYFALLVLFHSPTTPPSTPPGTNCDGTCSYVSAPTGFKVRYQLGMNQLIITNGEGNLTLDQVPLPAVPLFQTHVARAVYASGSLSVYLDGLLLVSMQTTSIPAGQIGFETYRTDLIVNSIMLATPSAERLSVSLTGSLDYFLRESINVQVAALVTDASTGQPVSGANVLIQIFNSSGSPVIPVTVMHERSAGTGVYVWTSNGTLVRGFALPKGVYLAQASASLQGGPVTEAILSFHVDPPADTSPEPELSSAWILVLTVLASAGTAALISLSLPRIRNSRRYITNPPQQAPIGARD